MTTLVTTILLAAGKSLRMGRCKQLLPLGKRRVIHHCLDTISKAGITEIIVVLRHADEDTTLAIEEYPVQIVYNNDQTSDMAGSILMGLSKVTKQCSAVLVYPVDYPLVKSSTLVSLLTAHRADPLSIHLPAWRNKKGHPVLLPIAVINQLRGEKTLRNVIRNNENIINIVPVDDMGTLSDMDTPSDYREIQKLYSQHSNKR